MTMTLEKSFKLEACDTCAEATFTFDADTLEEASVAVSVADGEDNTAGTFYLTADDLRALLEMLAEQDEGAAQ
jgi:hypothetical protein